jgi:hypothetical protein
MNYPNIDFLIILFLLVVLYCYNTTNKEKFVGALQQLYAKGPQDMYLTTNTGKYVYPHFPHMIWNNPTRLKNYYPQLHHYFNNNYHNPRYPYPRYNYPNNYPLYPYSYRHQNPYYY